MDNETSPRRSWFQRVVRSVPIVASLALVVGLLVGVGVGYKVEQARVHNDVAHMKKRVEQLTASSTLPPRHRIRPQHVTTPTTP